MLTNIIPIIIPIIIMKMIQFFSVNKTSSYWGSMNIKSSHTSGKYFLRPHVSTVTLTWSDSKRGLRSFRSLATHCNTSYKLRHTVTHCDTLQRIVTHCDVLRCTATHCDVLGRTARHHDIRRTTTHYDALRRIGTLVRAERANRPRTAREEETWIYHRIFKEC